MKRTDHPRDLRYVKQLVLEWLHKRNKSQAWLAAQIRITPTHLSMILNGSRGVSLENAKALEELTGIRATEFLGLPK